jgi:hypothetical protein
METPRPGSGRADLPSRHGPAWWFILTLTFFALGFALPALAAADTLSRLVLLGFSAAFLAALIHAWTWFTVHETGVTRSSPLGSRTWEWGEIGVGTATEVEGVIWDVLPQPYSSVAYEVHGRDGRLLFRIGVPIQRRGHLLRLIRREARLHAERSAAGAPTAPGI